MTEPQGHEDHTKWRDKYFNTIEQHEVAEKEWQSSFESIRKALVRLSVASEGFDPMLDAKLSELRRFVRSSVQLNFLHSTLDAIEEYVRQLDAGRKQNTAQIDQAIFQLLLHFNALKLPTRLKTQYEQLTKAELKTFTAAELTERITALSSFVKAVLEDIHQTTTKLENKLNHTSFFKRLFAAPELDEEPQVKKTPHDASESDSKRDAYTEESVDEPEVNEARLRESLRELIQHLPLPQRLASQRRDCFKRLEDATGIVEYALLLDELVALLKEACRLEHEEFESFVIEVNQQLERMHEFLAVDQGFIDETRDVNNEFDRDLRTQFSNMQVVLRDTDNLSELKSSVLEQISGAVKLVDAHKVSEEKRLQTAETRIAELQSALEQTEQHSAQLKEELSHHKALAHTDPLTSLPNRQAYNEALKREVARWQRYQHQLSIVIADIDHFKKLNDTYGHLAGDKVLKAAAKIMQQQLRETDFIARFGGEEFVIIMAETSSDVAKEVAEKLRLEIEQAGFHFRGAPVKITCSFGVSGFKKDDSPDNVFERADKALYEAKSLGRNQVVFKT